jgi:hypothetical protein
VEAQREPGDLSAEERERLHRAHEHLRNASRALEALTVITPVRGRWVAKPAPPDALEAAQLELHQACQNIWAVQEELLGWDPPTGAPAPSDR